MPLEYEKPLDVKKWYIEGFRKEFHDWLRMPRLKLRDACCLIYGKDPDKLPIGRDRSDGATWENNSPGIDSLFTFYELARLAALGDESHKPHLQAIKDPQDPQGEVLVTPSAIFEFALKHGVFEFVPDQEGAKKSILKIALRTVWSEAIAEQASIAESEAHERSAHPSEKDQWLEMKEAVDVAKKHMDGTWNVEYTRKRISTACTEYQKDGNKGIRSAGKWGQRRIDPVALRAWLLERRKNFADAKDTKQKAARRKSNDSERNI